jgi:hypothetical protein
MYLAQLAVDGEPRPVIIEQQRLAFLLVQGWIRLVRKRRPRQDSNLRSRLGRAKTGGSAMAAVTSTNTPNY